MSHSLYRKLKNEKPAEIEVVSKPRNRNEGKAYSVPRRLDRPNTHLNQRGIRHMTPTLDRSPEVASSAGKVINPIAFSDIGQYIKRVSAGRTKPREWPRGIHVTLCNGIAAGVYNATSACPPSWYAVNRLTSSRINALLRSEPIKILSC